VFGVMSVEGWQLKRLAEIGTIYSGSTPLTTKASLWDGDIVWVTPSDLSQLNTPYLTTSGKRITPQGLKGCSAHLLPPGSIILSSRAPIGYLAINIVECCTNQGCKSFRLKPEYNSEFIYYNLNCNINKIKSLGEGTTFTEISKTALSKVEMLFLEDKKEQEKIADILSTIDLAITQTEAIIAKQQRIKTGLMQDLLTKGIDENGNIRSEATHEFKDSAIGRIPVDWEVKELREVSLIIDPNPSHRYPPSSDVGIPIASTENFVGDNDFDLSFSEKVPFHVFKQQNKRCCFSNEDIVFARKGRLGFARYYGESEKVFSHTVVIFKPQNKPQIETHYLLWIVRFRDFFEQIDKRMNSNSGVPTLGVQFLGSIPVRVPKLSEQIQICLTLDSLEKRIEEEKRNLSKQKRLKTGLMQDLLTGKVRVTSLLEKEPASR
jgi:type I restriction enzyme, S subunit